jgi:hypothetical protein
LRIQTSHRGATRPFERDRQLALRCIPVGATIRSATATVAPVSADANGRFLETIGFAGSDGDWGAFKRTETDWVEVNLHARRKLASVDGTNLSSATLLVDLGGGFTSVDEHGGLGGDSSFPLQAGAQNLPGLTATGVRIDRVAADPDITVLGVTSPPTNVTMVIVGGPSFWTYFGDLVDRVTTPDFAPLLQEALAAAPVEHGHHVVGFLVHSDSIARLDVCLDIDLVVTASAAPEGVDQVSLPYSFGSTPESSSAALAVSMPTGSIAAPGATSGRVQGAFAPTRVVFGATGQVPIDGVAVVSAAGSHAEPFTVATTTLATSVDLFLAAVTASAQVAIDIVGDLDGKPDRTSLLSAVATRSFSRDDAPDSTWINVALPAEIELAAEQRYWVVVHARQGSVTWAFASTSSSPSLLATADGGMSWRAVADGPADAHFRLRHTTPTFHMPVELRIDASAGEVAVDLQRFGAARRIDFSLDFPEVADAINSSLAAAGANTVPLAEHIANGDFDHWFRLGSELRPAGTIEPAGGAFPEVPAFSPDGGVVYLASWSSDFSRVDAYDTYCRTLRLSVDIPLGIPRAMIVNPAGTLALVATEPMSDFEVVTASTVTVLDLVAGRTVGVPIPVGPGSVTDFAAVPNGTGVYFLLFDGKQTLVSRADWSAFSAAAEGGNPDLLERSEAVEGHGRSVSVGRGGSVYVVSAISSAAGTSTGAISVFDAELSEDSALLSTPVPTVDSPQDAVFVASGERLIVLGELDLAIVDPQTVQPVATLAIPWQGRRLAADPMSDRALVLTDEPVVVLDVATRSLQPTSISVSEAVGVAVSPPGNRAVITGHDPAIASFLRLGEDLPADWELTAGRVGPACFGNPSQPVAVLGVPVAPRQPVVVEAALSQVVPVQPEAPYRFSFDALAAVEGATAEILWRTDDCKAGRIDVVEIDALGALTASVTSLTAHERALTSPAGAVAAEVRFHTQEDVLLLDNVSLEGSTEALANASLRDTEGGVSGWETPSPQLTASRGGSGATVLHNGSATEAALSQLAAVTGSRYSLEAVARTDGDLAAAITLQFVAATGAGVDEPIRLPVDPLEFDRLAAAGDVPAGAADAQMSVVVPPGASVDIDRLSLRFDDPVSVSMGFVSEAPGELMVSDVSVGIDTAPPHRPPVPEDGLCPATPPGAEPGEDPDSCHCCACGERTPVRKAIAILTPAGRPGSVSACATCGGPRVKIGGRFVPGAVVPPVREFFVGRGDLPAPTAVGPRIIVEERLIVIDGIAESREARLRALGIATIVDLALADAAVVASLPGVSDRMANDFIREARSVVNERGRRILFDAEHAVVTPGPPVPRLDLK